MAKFELWFPIKNPFLVTQRFGEALIDYSKPPYNIPSGKHNGWDVVGEFGQLIRAAHDGIITFTGQDGSGGLGVVMRTKEMFEYNGSQVYFKTIYWHCKAGSFRVKPGDVVKVGDQLAECDSTGVSSGSHLHFGLKPIAQGENDWSWSNLEQNNGYFGAIDPSPYWNSYYAEDSQQVLGIYRAMIDILIKILEKLRNASKTP